MSLPKPNLGLIADVPREAESGGTETISPGPDFAPERAQASPSGRDSIIPADLRAKAIQALRDGLDATRRYWCKESKSFVAEPDYGVRVKTAELVLAYDVGRPVERQVKLTGDFTDYNDKLVKMCATPEGLKMAIACGFVIPEVLKSAKASEVADSVEVPSVSISRKTTKSKSAQMREGLNS